MRPHGAASDGGDVAVAEVDEVAEVDVVEEVADVVAPLGRPFPLLHEEATNAKASATLQISADLWGRLMRQG